MVITLILASVALTVSHIAQEEVESLVAKIIAFFCLILSLYLTPLIIKLFILLFLVYRQGRFNRNKNTVNLENWQKFYHNQA